MSVPVPWQEAIGGLLGVSKPIGIPKREVVAAYQFIEALRSDLEEPASAADETTLASIARVSLLELRLSRHVFKQGAIRVKTGDVRPCVAEMRALIRLKSDLLQRLTFKRGRRDVPSLQTIIASLSDDATPAGAEASTAHDRGAAANGTSGATA